MELQVFQNEGFSIRVAGDEANPLFVAKDVCVALNIKNVSDALSRLDDDEKGIVSTDTLKGTQNLLAVNESGLYSLILSSRKKEAKRFKKWVTSEVLPSIRKTGGQGPGRRAAPALQRVQDQAGAGTMSRRRLVIDADTLLYQVYPELHDDNDLNDPADYNLREGKKEFKRMIKEIEDDIAVTFEVRLSKKPPIVLISSETSFRKELYPQYKAKRTQRRSEAFYALRDWARKRYECLPGIEADDLAGWYARFKGEKVIVASTDKDVLYSLPGLKWDYYSTRKYLIDVTREDARRFTLLQTVMGDATDNIPGIPGVGEKTAYKLLDEYGWTWEGVVKAYRSRGLTRKDAILTRRLVGLDQLNKKKKLKLWKEKR